MTHIAIQEALDGKVVDWMEKSATLSISGRDFAKALDFSPRIILISTR
jgi:hypothetical protein